MRQTTIGRLLIDDALPPDLRGGYQALDKKGIQALFGRLAHTYPEQYREISHKLLQVGREAGFASGGYSFGLRHLMTPPRTLLARERLRSQVLQIAGDLSLSPQDREKKIVSTVEKARPELEKLIDEEMGAEKNPLWLQARAGAKGNVGNLASLVSGDLLYQDPAGKTIPLPVMRSYSEGLSPAAYFAGTYGARAGIVALKKSTAEAGYVGKQLGQGAHRLVVTAVDRDGDGTPDTPIGLPSTPEDADNEGAFLAAPAGPYTRNTLLTPRVLADLKTRGIGDILVRSPIAGGPPQGGVYARDVGIRERGRLAPVGDYVGLAAAASLSEPLTQATICLAEGTLVRMADWSIKTIEDIHPGEEVLGADNIGKTFPVRVLHRFDNGPKECYRSTFRCGRINDPIILESTLDHKVLMVRRMTSCKSASLSNTPMQYPVGTPTGRLQAVRTAEFDDCNRYPDEPFDLLLGLLLGDGCYTESVQGVHLSCFDPLLIEDITDYLAGLNLKAAKRDGHVGYYRISQVKEVPSARNELGQVVVGARNPIKRWLIDRDLYGKYAHEKVLPDEVYRWSNRSVARLLAGLYATDGSIYVMQHHRDKSKPSINFTSTSRRLIEQVRELLDWRFGIHCAATYGSTSKRKRCLYQANINTGIWIRRFADVIPLVGIKRVRMAELMTAWESSAVGKNVADGQYSRIPLRSREAIGTRMTYDLEVDHPDHLFVLANGLIVSNSSKHLGGVAGKGKSIGGFKAVNQIINIPKTYPGGAAHSQVDGRVESIEEAPQGGHYVTVQGQRHYLGQGVTPAVKIGDTVEAGDLLSDGLPNPAEIVRHKGVGEGRRQLVKLFGDVARASGFSPHRRNIELVARGLINHARLLEEVGDYNPEDIIPFSTLEAAYQPRPGHKILTPERSIGKYLEKPVLHHTIGTKVRPSMLDELKRYSIGNLTVHDEPPPFESVMVRAQDNLHHDPDWMTRMLGSNLEKTLLRGAARGDVSDATGTSYVPALAEGLHFGLQGKTKGWDPAVPPVEWGDDDED